MPFRDAEIVIRQAEEILAQCRLFARAGRAATWQEIDNRQRFHSTFSPFAKEVQFYNVLEETRNALVAEWEFFSTMLRDDRTRVYSGALTQDRAPEAAEAQNNSGALNQYEPTFDGSKRAQHASGSGRRVAGRKLSLLLADYLSEQRQIDGTNGAQHDVGIYVDFMIALLGDKALSAYTDDDFRRLGRELANISDRKGLTQAAAKTLWSRYQYATLNGWDNLKPLSTTTLQNRYRTGLNRFFAWAKTSKHLENKVTIEVVLSAENLLALPRDSFTDHEITQIMTMPSFVGQAVDKKWEPGNYLVQDHIYWGYIIMLLTGMRTSEVAQLRLNDILEAEGWYFFNLQPFDPSMGRVAKGSLKKLKTSNAARSIPLDLLLIDLGLLDRVKELQMRGESRLFPDWTYYTKPSGQIQWDRPLTRDWQYRRRKLGFARQDISLYSARHCMGERLDKAQIPQRIRDRLMGHAPTGAKGRYGSNQPADPGLAVLLNSLETDAIKSMRSILMPPFEKARRGEMILVKPWLS